MKHILGPFRFSTFLFRILIPNKTNNNNKSHYCNVRKLCYISDLQTIYTP